MLSSDYREALTAGKSEITAAKRLELAFLDPSLDTSHWLAGRTATANAEQR